MWSHNLLWLGRARAARPTSKSLATKPMTITVAHTPIHYQHARAVILKYQSWLGMDLSFQAFEKELEELSSMYGPPSGAMILAYEEQDPVGCVGLRDLGDSICEMKRMFVLPEHQGKGIGKALFTAFMTEADRLGYGHVRLDTVRALSVALALYKAAGFVEIPAYRYNPDPTAVYMELRVTQWRTRRSIES